MNNCAFVGVVLCRRWKIALSAQTAGVHSQISRNELVSCYRSFWGVVRNIFGARMRLYNRVNMSFFVRMRFYFLFVASTIVGLALGLAACWRPFA